MDRGAVNFELVVQETLQLSQAQTVHTPLPSATYRVQLSPEVLDPLCHGLGHAIFRLVLAKQQSLQSPALLDPQSLTADALGSQGDDLRPSPSLIAGKFGVSAEETGYYAIRRHTGIFYGWKQPRHVCVGYFCSQICKATCQVLLIACAAEAIAGLHVRTSYALATEGVLLTQSLLAQLHQLYHPSPMLS